MQAWGMQTDSAATPEIGGEGALVDHDRFAAGNGKFVPLHQRRRVPHPVAASRARNPARRSRAAGLDAQLGHGGDAGALGLRAGPGRRAGGDGHGLGTDRGGGLRRGVGAFVGADRRVSVSRRYGRRQLQHRGRAAGVRLVSAAPARAGDGHPPDRATLGNRRWAPW